MTRAQSFKALAGQSVMDRIALVTFTPSQSLNHQPSIRIVPVDDDPEIAKLFRACSRIRVQAI